MHLWMRRHVGLPVTAQPVGVSLSVSVPFIQTRDVNTMPNSWPTVYDADLTLPQYLINGGGVLYGVTLNKPTLTQTLDRCQLVLCGHTTKKRTESTVPC